MDHLVRAPPAAGKDFYGPDGVYPFAGKECARALAKFSTSEEGAKGVCTGACRDMPAQCSWG